MTECDYKGGRFLGQEHYGRTNKFVNFLKKADLIASHGFVAASSVCALVTEPVKWSPLRQEPEAPSNNATSRNCLLATPYSSRSRGSAFHPRREPGDAKARDYFDASPERTVDRIRYSLCGVFLIFSDSTILVIKRSCDCSIPDTYNIDNCCIYSPIGTPLCFDKDQRVGFKKFPGFEKLLIVRTFYSGQLQ
jgi:hypothetical protein